MWSWHLGSPGSLAVAPGRADITITSIIIIALCALKNMQKCVCVQVRGKPWASSSKIPSPSLETGFLLSLELTTCARLVGQWSLRHSLSLPPPS